MVLFVLAAKDPISAQREDILVSCCRPRRTGIWVNEVVRYCDWLAWTVLRHAHFGRTKAAAVAMQSMVTACASFTLTNATFTITSFSSVSIIHNTILQL